MLFLLNIFLFLTQFYGVQGNAIENANAFNEFIEGVIATNSEPEHSRHEAGKKTLTVADAAELLELVDEKISAKIVNSSNVAGQIVDVKNILKI